MTNANLCICNKCGNIFIDQNAQIGATVFNVNESKVSDLQYLKEKNPRDNECYWGCGVCETDAFLSDEVNESKAKKLGIIVL